MHNWAGGVVSATSQNVAIDFFSLCKKWCVYCILYQYIRKVTLWLQGGSYVYIPAPKSATVMSHYFYSIFTQSASLCKVIMMLVFVKNLARWWLFCKQGNLIQKFGINTILLLEGTYTWKICCLLYSCISWIL